MNFKRFFSIGILSWVVILGAHAIEVTKTTCEMTLNPLALATQQPRFGWQMQGENGCMQSAYEIEVYTLDKGEKHCAGKAAKRLPPKANWWHTADKH